MVVAKENRVLKVHVALSATAGCDLRFAYRFEAKPLHTRHRQAQCAQGVARLHFIRVITNVFFGYKCYLRC